MTMRAYSFISSCHSGDIIVAVIPSHIVVVTSSNVFVDVRHVCAKRVAIASSIIVLHSSGISLELSVWLVEGSGPPAGLRTGPVYGLYCRPPSVGRSNLGRRTTSVVSSPPASTSALTEVKWG